MKEVKKIKYERDKGTPIIREPGNAVKVHTGLWRSYRPVIDYKKCIGCKTCWLFCPVTAIKWVNGKPKINYHFCKGCGICIENCPVKAIKKVKE